MRQENSAASLPYGVVTLSESYGAARAEPRRIRNDARGDARTFRAFCRREQRLRSQAEHLLGTSGTVTTLAALALKLPRYNRARVDGSWHETRQMMRIVERIAELDSRRWPGWGRSVRSAPI